MLGFARDKDKDRYYLFPGQGGRSARRKHRKILLWAIVFGLLASGVLALVLWLMNKSVLSTH
jgi:hypothetical protein